MGGAVGKTRGHIKRLASTVHKIINHDPHHMGKTLSAVFGIAGSRYPSVLTVLFKSLFEFRRTADLPVFKSRTGLFADLLQRIHRAFREINSFRDQHIQRLFI